MSRKKRSASFWEACRDVGINLAFWVFVYFGLAAISKVAKLFDPTCGLAPTVAFLHFVDPKLWVAQIVGGVILLGLVAAVRFEQQSDDVKLLQSAVVEEFASVFKNFGSLTVTSAAAFLWVSFEVQPQEHVQIERFMAVISVLLGLLNLAGCFWRTYRLAQRRRLLGGVTEGPLGPSDQNKQNHADGEQHQDVSGFRQRGRLGGHGRLLGGQSNNQAEKWAVSIPTGDSWDSAQSLGQWQIANQVTAPREASKTPMCPRDGLTGSSGATD